MGVRREARVLALKCLHQWDQRPDEGRELALPFIREQAHDPDLTGYCRCLLEEFWSHRAAIDERIATAAEHWSVDRMAVVDRSILRIAVTEICVSTMG